MMGRLAKIVMCLALAAFAGIVALDNLIDYGANFAFVQHVLSMDTTFSGSAVRGRAITSPALWRAFYALIIAGEGITALLYLVAAGALWRTRRMRAAQFAGAKRWVYAATTAGFLVWFFGFEVIGGEYFAMWQSPRWNGQEAAFRFYMTMLLALVVVNQRDEEMAIPSERTHT